MPKSKLPRYETKITPCTINAGRYRWKIWQHGKVIQSSTISYQSQLAARDAGRVELAKLIKKHQFSK